MNHTEKFFPLVEIYQKKIKAAEKEKKENLQQEYTHYITMQVKEALKEGYTLLIDDIVRQLDLEEAYIRKTILEQLEYIILPSGGAEAFTVQEMPIFNFMELRIRRWKKVYIQKASFEKFMKDHLFIQAPYQNIYYDKEMGRYRPEKNKCGKEEILWHDLPYTLSLSQRFIRKSTYVAYATKKKTEAFYRKTKGDIIVAYEEGLIDSERLKTEMATLALAIKENTYNLQAYQNEAEKLAQSERRIKIKLCVNLQDKNKGKKNDIILYDQTGYIDQ